MKTAIIGAGSFGTALANVLSLNQEILLYSVEIDVVDSINRYNKNLKYFPNNILNKNITATSNIEILSGFDILFFAIPSQAVVDFVTANKQHLKKSALLVNLAKGFGKGEYTIYESLKAVSRNPICSLKGPTFAAELINNLPSAMTLGAESAKQFHAIRDLFKNTCIQIDWTRDIIGVEILSILKNIYAIIMGIVDAYYNSANVRFVVFTKAFNEMRSVLECFGASEETLSSYCGIGDFGLTALNDLSRNRTLGLLIGKGFLNNNISDSVVLEGKRALNIFYNKLQTYPRKKSINFSMLESLFKFFNKEIDIRTLVNELIK